MKKFAAQFIQINNKSKDLRFNSKEVDQKLLDLVYQQAKAGFISSFACAAVILFGLLRPTNYIIVTSWFVFSMVVTFIRIGIREVYLRQESPEKNYRFWRNLFIFSACLGGSVWGLVGSVLYTEAGVEQRLLIILILAGVTAGAVPLLSGISKASIGFLSFALVPLIINILFIKHSISMIFDVTLITFWLYLIAITLKTQDILCRSYSLQFENFALLSSLTDAKISLEDSNSKLQQAATHDPLTNAANRNLFNVNLITAIKRAHLENRKLALLFIDIDNFKEVNDIFGHPVGDQVLLGAFNHLESVCKQNGDDNISRLGGDEFTVILEDIKDMKQVAAIARRVCKAIATPVRINDRDVKITASVGISIYPSDGEEPEVLMHNADKSMYYVKQKGGNDFLFSASMLAK